MPLPSPRPSGVPVGRRVVLGLVGLGAAGVLAGGSIQRGLSTVLGPIENRDPTGIVSLLPVGNSFRYYSVTRGAPRQDADSYRLELSGLIAAPRTWWLAELQAMPQTTLRRDFQCVTGWRVPEVPWSGVRLADLLDTVGVSSQARAVRFTSFDGTYTESLPLEVARRADVLVALRMLGDDVTHDHGGPVRLYAATQYGYKSLKWLAGIELTAAEVPGYWETRGYDLDGTVGASNGRDDEPTS